VRARAATIPLATLELALLARLVLGAELGQLAQQGLDVDLVLEVHLEIGVGTRAVLQALPVLAHHDQRALQAHQDRKRKVE
jgi:hypothetical protein